MKRQKYLVYNENLSIPIQSIVKIIKFTNND